jgi:hypothetical protein
MRHPLAAPSGTGTLLTVLVVCGIVASILWVRVHAAQPAAWNLVENGGFELGTWGRWATGAWSGEVKTECAEGSPPGAPVVTDESVRAGEWAARLGHPMPQVSSPSGAAWISQVVRIPEAFTRPELIFDYRIITNDIIAYSALRAEVRRPISGGGRGELLEELLRDGYDPGDDRALPGYDMGWKRASFELSAYRGQTIQLYFEVKNEHCVSLGIWAYLDNVRRRHATTRAIARRPHRPQRRPVRLPRR